MKVYLIDLSVSVITVSLQSFMVLVHFSQLHTNLTQVQRPEYETAKLNYNSVVFQSQME